MIVSLFTPELTSANLKHLAEVERLAWSSDGENIAAENDKVQRRLQAFAAGVTLATVGADAQPAGSQYAFQLNWNGDPTYLSSWDEMTADGWYDRVHVPGGNTGFLVGVGVVPACRGIRMAHQLRWSGSYKLSELLIARTLDTLFAHGSMRVIGNARVPAYHQRPGLSIEEYCSLRRADGTLFDPVLRFHERMGARILKPAAYSMEDAESLNAGCWVVYENPFPG